jgi:thiol-disulfide isomerase/thioredoxin
MKLVKTLRYSLGSLAVLCAAWLAIDIFAGETTPIAPREHSAVAAFDGAVAWINSPPLTADKLRGKVVLVQFWTFSCINWQRTLPHVTAWAEKYKSQGLVVVGVHTPEFGFEKDLANVREATSRLAVGYPVAVDTDYKVWQAFGNAYWPALYLIDAHGAIRYRQFGEGEFERSEKVIQQLLAEAGAKDVPTDLVRVNGSGSMADADWANLRSPETYAGADRTEGFSSPGGMASGRTRVYQTPERLRRNAWALAGEWKAEGELVRLERANGRIAFRFHARDLHMVMGPVSRGTPIEFRIRIDGQPPGAAHGVDVDGAGRGTLVEKRLYQLVRQDGAIDDRTFEIEFLEPGAEAYSFTFG